MTGRTLKIGLIFLFLLSFVFRPPAFGFIDIFGDSGDINEQVKKRSDRIETRLKALNFYKRSKDPLIDPTINNSSIYGTLYYGYPREQVTKRRNGGIIKVSRPQWRSKRDPQGKTIWNREGKFTTSYRVNQIRISEQDRSIRKNAAQLLANYKQTNRHSLGKTRIAVQWKLVDKKVIRNDFHYVFRPVAKEKVYGGKPGGMLIVYQDGETTQWIGKADNYSLGIELKNPPPKYIVAYFDLDDKRSVIVKSGGMNLHRDLHVPEIPTPDEAVIDEVMEVLASELSTKASLEAYDLNPLFNKGNILNEESPVESLLLAKEERDGAAADGVSRLLIRGDHGGEGKSTFQVEGGKANGTLQPLFNGEAQKSGNNYYTFAIYTPPEELEGDSPDLVKTKPIRYRNIKITSRFTPEKGGPRAVEADKEISLVAPPVVLMHGTYSTPSKTWDDGYLKLEAVTPEERAAAKSAIRSQTDIGFMGDNLNIDNSTLKAAIKKRREQALQLIGSDKTMKAALEEKGFIVFMVDYQLTNGLGLIQEARRPSHFKHNRMVLWDEFWDKARHSKSGKPNGIKKALEYFRENLDVAATQADVVGHSMGGVLPRVYASDAYTKEDARYPKSKLTNLSTQGYRRPDNYKAGDINRLISICSTHYGSDLSHVMAVLRSEDLANEDLGIFERMRKEKLNFGLKWYAGLKSGAANDQVPESHALKLIGPTKVPSHAVACVARVPDIKNHFHGEYLHQNVELMYQLFKYPGLLEKILKLKDREQEAEYLLKAIEEIGWYTEKNNLIDLHKIDEWVKANQFRFSVFGFTRNDAVVRVTSQWGGMPPQYRSTINGLVHGYAPLYPEIQEKVVDLLTGPLTNFSIKGFSKAGERLLNKPPNFPLLSEDRLEAIRRSNIVPRHALAISQVAKARNEIIIIRPVNPDSTHLIAKGATTKSMHVKGKSSNWGPQKGYIAVDQAFSKLAEEGDKKINKYNCDVRDSLKKKKAYRKALTFTEGETEYQVRILKNKMAGRKRPLVVLRDSAGNYKSINDESLPASISDDNTQPLEVLTDTTKNEYMTADYDFLAIGTKKESGPAELHPEMGSVTPLQKRLIVYLNAVVQDKGGYTGGNVVWHGPENQFSLSPGVDYPNTAFEPDGDIITIDEGPPGKTHMYAKRYFRKKIEDGWNLAANPRWNWEGKGTPHYREFTVERGWPDEDPPKEKQEEDLTKQCKPLPPCKVALADGEEGQRTIADRVKSVKEMGEKVLALKRKLDEAKNNKSEVTTLVTLGVAQQSQLDQAITRLQQAEAALKKSQQLLKVGKEALQKARQAASGEEGGQADETGSGLGCSWEPPDPDDGDGDDPNDSGLDGLDELMASLRETDATQPFSEDERRIMGVSLLNEYWQSIRGEVDLSRLDSATREQIAINQAANPPRPVTDNLSPEQLTALVQLTRGILRTKIDDDIKYPEDPDRNMVRFEPLYKDTNERKMELANEVAAYHLGRLLDVNAPFSELVRDNRDPRKILGVMTRWAGDGKNEKSLSKDDTDGDLKSGENRGQYIRDLILSAILGDQDRKFNNYVIYNGKLYSIDRGSGTPIEPTATIASTMRGWLRVGRRYENRIRPGEIQRDSRPVKLREAVKVTARDFQTEYEKVKGKLTRERIQKVVEEAYLDQSAETQRAIVETMVGRAQVLESVFKNVLP